MVFWGLKVLAGRLEDLRGRPGVREARPHPRFTAPGSPVLPTAYLKALPSQPESRGQTTQGTEKQTGGQTERERTQELLPLLQETAPSWKTRGWFFLEDCSPPKSSVH